MNVQNFVRNGCTGGLIASLATSLALVSGLGQGDRVMAQMTQQELDANGVTVVASPYQGGAMHQLLILEQLTSARACWSEQKNQLSTNQTITIVNPLLADFDFSGICGRATDSNGFSVRMGGRDFDWRYRMQVVEQNGDLLLMARNTVRNQMMPDLLVGRVGGSTPGFAKINLEPGWRITRRVAQGKLTGHFYLTIDRSIEQIVAEMQGLPKTAAATAIPMSSPGPVIVPMPSVSGGTVPASIMTNMTTNSVSPGFSVPPSPEVLK